MHIENELKFMVFPNNKLIKTGVPLADVAAGPFVKPLKTQESNYQYNTLFQAKNLSLREGFFAYSIA